MDAHTPGGIGLQGSDIGMRSQLEQVRRLSPRRGARIKNTKRLLIKITQQKWGGALRSDSLN